MEASEHIRLPTGDLKRKTPSQTEEVRIQSAEQISEVKEGHSSKYHPEFGMDFLSNQPIAI